VKKALTLVLMAAAATALLAACATASKVHKQVRYVRLVATSGYYVDNEPSGKSGGDLSAPRAT
jgi:outer membrane protein assembly factor BamE (lipoprotein component of BamABCDE complex)